MDCNSVPMAPAHSVGLMDLHALVWLPWFKLRNVQLTLSYFPAADWYINGFLEQELLVGAFA
jgi:hypothetical protein